MKRLALPLVTGLLLAGCATVPAPDMASTGGMDMPAMAIPAAPQGLAPLSDATTSSLPRTARPYHYTIEVTPDAQALTFTGKSAVDMKVFEATPSLTLNANELTIASARLVPAGGGAAMDLQVATDPQAQTATFTAPATIQPGTYRLETEYSGTINTQANGLFALNYLDKRTGKDVRALFTQFEAPDARRFAPMFDEPAYKATFDLSAIVPADQMAVSNTPAASEDELGDGTKRVTFMTTPKMSTYLLFFGLGDFERLAMPATTKVEAGIVAPAGSGEQGRYALEGLAGLIPYYEGYFGQPFPLPKIDNIAGPGQSQFFGAMENWGAVFTFERILLNDPKITSARGRQSIYEVQAHEVAHQWFGDLVTMAWWDDLWLNEGFASWMATKATDHFHPEWYPLLDRVGGREAAMGLDAYASTHPIVQTINTVEETNQAFDTITYQKGEAVISMLEAYAGEDTWRDGLRRYMAAHKFDNAKTEDLWAAIEAAGATSLTGIARDFTTQPGVPLVQVGSATCSGGKTNLSLTQSQFSQDQKDAVAANPQGWRIPLLVSVGGGAPMRSVMDGKSASMTLNGCGTVLVNAGQLGYYRTLYPAKMLTALRTDMGKLAPIDQLGLLRDQSALSSAGYQKMGVALDLLAAVPRNANPLVAESAIGSWAGLYALLEDDDAAQAKVAKMATAAWGPRLQALGYDPRPSDQVPEENLRSSLLGALGAMGDEKVLAEAAKRFDALKTNPAALDGPLKTTWLAIVASNAIDAQWNQLLSLAQNSDSSVQRSTYYALLGAADDDTLAQRALDLALSGDVGMTDSAAIISAVASGHGDLAFNFVLDNQAKVNSLVDDSGMARFLARLAGGVKDEKSIARLEAFKKTLSADLQKPIDRSIAINRQRESVKPRQIAEVKSWLAAQ
ncbi:M1 family metallopeptidase [Erythrobacter sp. 3-20A1M]|uniref:M1 family metallopeptidase n=1 Tax=Erythrobacter sp. 3-20A1M TaxID=2653850 RepID=UPI00203EB8CB|nr:M1 family metallopeptidase [Erythrobacter sp. 3-20A1M]